MAGVTPLVAEEPDDEEAEDDDDEDDMTETSFKPGVAVDVIWCTQSRNRNRIEIEIFASESKSNRHISQVGIGIEP